MRAALFLLLLLACSSPGPGAGAWEPSAEVRGYGHCMSLKMPSITEARSHYLPGTGNKNRNDFMERLRRLCPVYEIPTEPAVGTSECQALARSWYRREFGISEISTTARVFAEGACGMLGEYRNRSE